jgi:protein NEDD1
MHPAIKEKEVFVDESDKTATLRESKTLLDVPRTRTRAGSSASRAGAAEDEVLIRRTRSRTVSSASRVDSEQPPLPISESVTSTHGRTSVTERLSARSSTSGRLSASTRPRAHSNVVSGGSSGKLSAASRMTPSPDLPSPGEVVISPLKRSGKTRMGVLGLGTPEVDQWVQAGRGGGNKKGKRKKVEFQDDSDEGVEGEGDDSETEKMKKEGVHMAVQISPRRPPATKNWTAVPSPLRHAMPTSSPSGSTAHDLLRTIVSDVLYDLHRDQKAQLTGMHLDMIKMGRGWKKDLNDVLRELGELREENGRLKEENERLRRGY